MSTLGKLFGQGGIRTIKRAEFPDSKILNLIAPGNSEAISSLTAAAVSPSGIAAAAESSAAAASAVFSRSSLVHVKRTGIDLDSVQCGDCGFRFLVVWHLDESESAGTSGISVGDNVHGINRAVLLEQASDRALCRVVTQVTYEDIHLTKLNSLSRAFFIRNHSRIRREKTVKYILKNHKSQGIYF